MTDHNTTSQPAADNVPASVEAFEEPRLVFIEPKLVKQGDATQITKQTGGFFGTFDPNRP